MANVDKNQAVINFLNTCPYISGCAVFFNFANAKDTNKQIVSLASDKIMETPYIDGSVMKRYEFTVIDYKSASYNALVSFGELDPGTNENVEDMLDVQSIIDWITEQADLRNYPNFGNNCEIDKMSVLSDNPNIAGVDTSMSIPLAKYSFTIRIEYIDNTKRIY